MPGSVPIESVVSASATTVVLVPARTGRRSLVIFNNADQDLYVRYGNGASLTDWVVKIPPDWYGRMPWGELYTGIITGIWDGTPTGDAHITELVH